MLSIASSQMHHDKAKLSQGIDQSFTVVAAMVKAHPCLRIDFQVYLRNDGAVLNIDLDRCFHRNGTIVACSSLDLPCKCALVTRRLCLRCVQW